MHFVGSERFIPDFLAIVTAYLFLICGLTGSLIFSIGQGLFIDLFSGGMHGLFTFLYTSVFCGIWLGSRFFNLQSPKGQLFIVLLTMLSKKVLLFIMLGAFSQEVIFPKSFVLNSLALSAVTAILAPVVFYLLDHLKGRAFDDGYGASKERL